MDLSNQPASVLRPSQRTLRGAIVNSKSSTSTSWTGLPTSTAVAQPAANGDMGGNGARSHSASTSSTGTSVSHSDAGDAASLLNTEDFSKLLDVIHTASQLTSGGNDVSFPGVCILRQDFLGEVPLRSLRTAVWRINCRRTSASHI